jgi:heme-degrading monooxygenase HmoA
MYVATTRFHIFLGHEKLFETAWRRRESYLNTMPGYRGMLLLRGASESNHTVYFSQFIWNTQKDFENWTQSKEFVKAHIQFGDTSGLFEKKPTFESFEVVLQEIPSKS